MAQLIIDVADDKLAFFRSLIDELENVHIVDNEDYDHIFTPEFVEELDKRSQSPRKGLYASKRYLQSTEN
jgi:hypothetical protein